MITKEQERAELHRTIWQIATNLRGSVDGWDFKQYVLGILFYRFISENLTNYINDDERRSGKKDFDYSNLSDEEAEFVRADTVKEKGFYILPSELFKNVTKKARNDPNLNETLSAVFKNIKSAFKPIEGLKDLNERQLKAIDFLRQNKSIKSKIYANINNISLPIALRDIAELIKFGYLKKVGSFRGAYYVLKETKDKKAEIGV